MVIWKRQPEIDIQEAGGTHEFTVVPRSMFATNRKILHCPAKSALFFIIEKLPANTGCRTAIQDTVSRAERIRVSVMDAMAEAQSLDNSPGLESLKRCSDLADHLTSRVFEEVRLIFNRYNLPSSHSSCPILTTCMEQWQEPQSSFTLTEGLRLGMERRRQCVDSRHDNTTPSTWGYN